MKEEKTSKNQRKTYNKNKCKRKAMKISDMYLEMVIIKMFKELAEN